MSTADAPKKPRETDDVPVPATLRKSLKNRHIQLIALGGAIGTGLFYGSSESIALAGPSILLAYLVGGFAIFMIVRALSEMSVEDPKAGAFSYYATRYWSKRAGFISGWNYWFNYILVSMVELSVVGSFVNYWFPAIPTWVSAAVFLVIICAANLLGVSKFGEFEFWFAIIKIVAVIAMIIGGLAVIIFVLPTASGVRASFANWFTVGNGFFPNGLMGQNSDGSWTGLLMALVVVMFSFGGTELIGITAGETEDPKTTIPRATNDIIWRILVFYIGALGVIMAVVPWNTIDGNVQPVRANLRFRGHSRGCRYFELRVPDRCDERLQLRPVRQLPHVVLAGQAGQCARLLGQAQLARRASGRRADVRRDHRHRRGRGVRVA